MAKKGLAALAKKVKQEAKDAQKPMSDLFLEAIDNYLVKSRILKNEEYENSKTDKRPSIKPSSYYKCIRKLWYDFMGFPKKERWYPRSIRILENGTVLHEWIQTQIFMDMDKGDYAIKLLPANELPEYGKEGIEFIKEHKAPDMEVKFKDRRHTEKYAISAMIDGHMEFMNLQMLFEFKTINPKDFELLIAPLKDHIKQGAIYAMCLGVPRVMFLYYDKGSQFMKPYLVEYNDDQITWAKARCQTIEEYLLNQELPPKEKGEGKDCDFCPFKALCDKDVAGKTFKVDDDGYPSIEEIE